MSFGNSAPPWLREARLWCLPCGRASCSSKRYSEAACSLDMASTEEFTPRPAEDQDEAAVNETSLDEGVELPDENALPTAKAKKHGSKRHYARRGFPFRFALRTLPKIANLPS